jgi:hypothetical protein
MAATKWQKRVASADWDAVGAELDDFGGALLPQLLTASEAAKLRSLYSEDGLFRATIEMGRYRFGEGEYRYFARPYPEPIDELKQALYPRLLPIARDWWSKLGRATPWPDNLDDWLEMCHAAGQMRSTAILLKYGSGDWNALHRDLYGDLVFPLQVVINLSEPGVDHTGGEFLLLEQRPRAQSRHRHAAAARARFRLHHPRASGAVDKGLVGRPCSARRFGGSLRRAVHARPRIPRRRMRVRGTVGGHRGTRIYGRPDCPSALRAITPGSRPSRATPVGAAR